jgi:phosphoribosyl 1,2-cyclic phosphodiesterase
MEAIALQSGSNGNSIYIETAGVKLLFDAGLNCSESARRLAGHGINIRDIDAVVISHDHADHVRHAGALQRKFKLPLYMTEITLDASLARHKLGRIENVNYFRAGKSIYIGDVCIRTIATPHDGADGVVFIIESGNKRLGIMTDLGHVFEGLHQEIARLDAVFLESNYDPDMLTKGPYPSFLKKRIQGPRGHISNRESAELLSYGKRLKWACLSHLSQQNNYPALALKTHRMIVPQTLPLHVAGRDKATAILKI